MGLWKSFWAERNTSLAELRMQAGNLDLANKTYEADRQLADAVAANEKALDGLKRDFKVIRMEWEDVYDRMTKVMSRLNARIRKAERVEPLDEGKQGTEQVPPAGSGTHAVLEHMRGRRR